MNWHSNDLTAKYSKTVSFRRLAAVHTMKVLRLGVSAKLLHNVENSAAHAHPTNFNVLQSSAVAW